MEQLRQYSRNDRGQCFICLFFYEISKLFLYGILHMFLTQNLMRNQNLKEKIQNIFLEKSYEQILNYADNVDFDVF